LRNQREFCANTSVVEFDPSRFCVVVERQAKFISTQAHRASIQLSSCRSGGKPARPRSRCRSGASRSDSRCPTGTVSSSRIAANTGSLSRSVLPRCGGRWPSARRLYEAMVYPPILRKPTPDRKRILSKIRQINKNPATMPQEIGSGSAGGNPGVRWRLNRN
jgi:hypothetical protein